MKIGFIGNTNNYPFSLALAIRRLGHEVIFVVDHKLSLDRPEGRYPDSYTGYGDWIFDHSYVEAKICLRDYMKPLREIDSITGIIDLLTPCDAYVVNGLWPILISQLNKPYFIQITGSDIEQYADERAFFNTLQLPFKEYKPELEPYYLRFAKEFATVQKKSFAKACGINSFPQGMVPNVDRLLSQIPLEGKRFQYLLTDCHDLKQMPPPKNETLRLFNVSRLNWVYPIPPGYSELDYKGTDILLKGFSLYLHQNNRPMRLTIARKGLHIKETLQLIDDFAISDNVDLVNELSQDVFLEHVRNSDIISDDFSEISALGMGALDAMAIGRPILSGFKKEIQNQRIDGDFPICQATTPEEICEQLILLSNKTHRQNIGAASREYATKFFATDIAALSIVNNLQNTVNNCMGK